ncbi:MAG: EscU/YscU/HrcU family type III secretion system export apparatus switch protein, partial [Bacillota bacterium]
KGEGHLAQRIKDKARELEIEIVEEKALARALNETTEIGEEIPPDLYQAVAEILAFIYNENNRSNIFS